jgi:hypothetical protein
VRISGLWVVVNFQERAYFTSRDLPDIPYLLKPHLRTQWAGGDICSNSDGLRNCSDYTKDHPNSRRILVVGDSLVFGYGVGQEQTISAHLQNLLSDTSANAGNKPVEVINVGIEGFSAINEAALIDCFLDKYSPDIIVWLLIPNDWDDALAVTPEGTMTTNRGSYAAAAQWLRMTWGISSACIHYENVLSEMGPVQQAWALGQAVPEQAPKGFFAKNSYLYNLISSFLQQPASSNSSGSGPCYPYRQDTKLTDWPILPELEAIHVSPLFSERFEQSIQRAVSKTTARRTPLVIMGMDVPVKQSLLKGSNTAIVDDIIAYLGMDFDSFRKRYNLRWDPHFTSSGNALLAQAMYSSLVRHQLITPSPGQPTLPYRSRERYWEAYDDWRQKFINSFIFSEIDFENFKNVHQIVGGLYPPRIFPIKPGAPVSLILKNSPSDNQFTLRGVNPLQKTQAITVTITGQSATTILLPSGAFEESFKLVPQQKQPLSPILDVKISCAQEPCESITLHRIGFEASTKRARHEPAHSINR